MTLELANFTELILEDSMNIDAVKWHGERLRADFGSGFGATAVVGSTGGLYGWTLGAGVLPADDAYGNLVNNKNRFDYYFDFFKEHTTGDQDVFQIEYRGKKYHASFKDADGAYQRHSEDLFTPEGIELIQRRVPDIYYLPDGSIFDPAGITGVWGWYYSTNGATLAIDQSGNLHHLTSNGNILDHSGTVTNGFFPSRFNQGATNTGFLNTTADPTIYEAFFAIKINETTFSNNAGLLTSSTGNAALLADDTVAKLQNLGFGGTYSYKLNGVALTEATQNMPMQAFGIVHARWSGGIALTNLQIGKDRGTAGTFIEADIGEIVLCNAALSTLDSGYMDAYLMRKWGI